ncbi:MAG: hypothetical protein ACE5E0_03030, partial [Terriglobia bacterium]
MRLKSEREQEARRYQRVQLALFVARLVLNAAVVVGFLLLGGSAWLAGFIGLVTGNEWLRVALYFWPVFT